MAFKTFNILIITKDEETVKLLENYFNVFSYDNLDEAKKFYEINSFYVDLILNTFDANIKVTMDGEEIRKIEKDSLVQQINDILKTFVKEIDFNKNLALSMLDENERIYFNSLRRYCEQYDLIGDILKPLLEEKEYMKIREYVHKIKGISLYLGSEKLYQMAMYIEQKIVSNQVTDFDIINFINYNKRILEYSKEQVENV